jgi:parvulin-like peptidyl-prolyl isomerase
LQQHLLSLDDFEYLLHIQALSEKLAEHLFADRVESHFYGNRLDYAGVVMYEVVLEDKDLAMELFYELQEGEITFQQIARKYVRDLSLRRAGGYRGIVRRSELKPEVSAAVFTARPPQLLEPIKTSRGFHLIVVEEIIQPKLDEQLQAQIINNLFSMWLKQQINEAQISVDLKSSDAIAKKFAPSSSQPQPI